VIRAAVNGALVPVGRTPQFRGIMGYLFLLDDLRRYRPVSERSHSHETYLNFREAASVLSVKCIVVRALFHHGVLAVAQDKRTASPSSSRSRRYGLSLPAKELRGAAIAARPPLSKSEPSPVDCESRFQRLAAASQRS